MLDRLSIDRAAVIEALREEGIGMSVHFIPLHLHPYYRRRWSTTPDDFPVAEPRIRTGHLAAHLGRDDRRGRPARDHRPRVDPRRGAPAVTDMSSTSGATARVTGPAWLAGAVLIGVGAVVVAVAGGPSVVVLLAAGVVGTAVVIYAPGVLFAAYLLIAFYKGAVQTYSPIDITFVLAILNMLQIIPVIVGRPPNIARSGLVFWLALTFLIFAGVLYAPDQNLALGAAIRWSALAFAPLLAGALRVGSDPRYVRQFLWTFFGMGVVTVGLGIAQLSGSERLTVLGANTIGVGRAALLVPLVGVLFVLRQRGLLLRAATVVLIPAAIVVALSTGSRGPILALLVLAMIGAIRQIPRLRSLNWRLTGAIGGLALASVIAVSVVGPSLPGISLDRFARFGDFIQGGLSGDGSSSSGDTSAGARVDLFGLALSMFEERPVLGFGTAGFEATSPRYLRPLEAEAYPHNALLQFASEYGIVGLAVFVAFILIALFRRFPTDNLGTTVRIILVFFLLNAMVSGDIFSDRESWGLVLLVLFIEVPRRVSTWAGRPVAVASAGPPTLQPASPT